MLYKYIYAKKTQLCGLRSGCIYDRNWRGNGYVDFMGNIATNFELYRKQRKYSRLIISMLFLCISKSILNNENSHIKENISNFEFYFVIYVDIEQK